MKKLLVTALFAASTFAMPTLLVTPPVAAATCGDSVPAEWKRPGGYCDQLGSKNSLTGPVEGIDCEKYTYLDLMEMLRGLDIGGEILVADMGPCDK